jgi:NAD(P)-dependent dehydrogenase (short-subunit alcohol dehydrogenase family)
MSPLPPRPRAAVTGAGGGLGRALCLALARRHARIIVSDRNVSSAEETGRLARDAGAADVRVVACDVSIAEEVEALARATDDAFGGADLVVNNAGIACGGRVGEISLEDWRRAIGVNLWGVVHGCHAFVPRLRRQGSGHVVNVAAAAGLFAIPRMGAYATAKAGVVALTETLAVELHGSGVSASVVCPSFFRTNIVQDGLFADATSRDAAHRLIGRVEVSADEVAARCLSAIERGELHIVPMADARWLWRVKRAAPRRFGLVARVIERVFTSKPRGG